MPQNLLPNNKKVFIVNKKNQTSRIHQPGGKGRWRVMHFGRFALLHHNDVTF